MVIIPDDLLTTDHVLAEGGAVENSKHGFGGVRRHRVARVKDPGERELTKLFDDAGLCVFGDETLEFLVARGGHEPILVFPRRGLGGGFASGPGASVVTVPEDHGDLDPVAQQVLQVDQARLAGRVSRPRDGAVGNEPEQGGDDVGVPSPVQGQPQRRLNLGEVEVLSHGKVVITLVGSFNGDVKD